MANKFVNGARDSEIERERELWRYVVTLDIQHVYIYMYMTIRVHVYIRINICIYIIYCCNSTSCHVSSHLYNQGVQLRNQLCGIPGILILSTRRNTCQHHTSRILETRTPIIKQTGLSLGKRALAQGGRPLCPGNRNQRVTSQQDSWKTNYLYPHPDPYPAACPDPYDSMPCPIPSLLPNL